MLETYKRHLVYYEFGNAGILLSEHLETNFGEIRINLNKTFHSWKPVSKYRLWNGVHFV